MQGFDELQNVTLPRDIQTDQGVISAGTVVDSHMIFLNRGADLIPEYLRQCEQDWTFDGLVLGVMSDKSGTYELASTDILGLPTTVYPTGTSSSGRGLKGNYGSGGPNDGYVINGNSLTVAMKVTQPGDWIRVVTSDVREVPEPSSMLLFATGLLGLARLGRKLKNK
jgi:hypothetical protein